MRESVLWAYVLSKDPRGRIIVTASSDHYFSQWCLYVRPYQTLVKQNKFQVSIVIATGGIVGQAGGIIVLTHLMWRNSFCVCNGVTRSGKQAASTWVILSNGTLLWKAAPSNPVGSTGRPMRSSGCFFLPEGSSGSSTVLSRSDEAPPGAPIPDLVPTFEADFTSAGVTSWISSSSSSSSSMVAGSSDVPAVV